MKKVLTAVSKFILAKQLILLFLIFIFIFAAFSGQAAYALADSENSPIDIRIIYSGFVDGNIFPCLK